MSPVSRCTLAGRKIANASIARTYVVINILRQKLTSSLDARFPPYRRCIVPIHQRGRVRRHSSCLGLESYSRNDHRLWGHSPQLRDDFTHGSRGFRGWCIRWKSRYRGHALHEPHLEDLQIPKGLVLPAGQHPTCYGLQHQTYRECARVLCPRPTYAQRKSDGGRRLDRLSFFNLIYPTSHPLARRCGLHFPNLGLSRCLERPNRQKDRNLVNHWDVISPCHHRQLLLCMAPTFKHQCSCILHHSPRIHLQTIRSHSRDYFAQVGLQYQLGIGSVPGKAPNRHGGVLERKRRKCYIFSRIWPIPHHAVRHEKPCHGLSCRYERGDRVRSFPDAHQRRRDVPAGINKSKTHNHSACWRKSWQKCYKNTLTVHVVVTYSFVQYSSRQQCNENRSDYGTKQDDGG